MNEQEMARPRRQSLVGVAVIFLRNLRIAINIFVSVIFVQMGLNFSILGLDLKGIGILLAVIFLIISYLQYRRFFFYVQDDKFVIEKGLLSRDKITIPFGRIQTVNINQNLLQQVLGVVALKVDTAGSAEKEIEIAALSKKDARQLQQFLIDRKEALSETSTGGEEEVTSDPRFSGRQQPLVKLGIKDLLLVGLTENHLRTGLVLVAVVYGYLAQYKEFLLKPFEPYLEEQASHLTSSWLVLAPVGLILFLFISTLLSMLQSVLRYFNLTFFVDEKGVQLVSGLLKRSEYQLPVNKIQYLKWKSNPLRKLIGLQTLVIKQAGSQATGDRKSVKVPGCKQAQLDVVLDTFYPERRKAGFFLYRAHKLLFMQMATWMGLLPALAMAALAFLGNYWLAVPALYLPLALYFIFRYYRSVGMAVNRDLVIIKKGWVFPEKLALKFYKLQDVRFSQSIFQKRRNLASITFYTAAGEEKMPHIPKQEALEVYNYCLYKIESSEEKWM